MSGLVTYWGASVSVRDRSLSQFDHRYYLGRYRRFEDALKPCKRAEEELHDKFLMWNVPRAALVALATA